MITYCYNHIIQNGDTTGRFREEDVTIEDEVLIIKIHKSTKPLARSLEKFAKEVLPNPPNNMEHQNFLNTIPKVKSER